MSSRQALRAFVIDVLAVGAFAGGGCAVAGALAKSASAIATVSAPCRLSFVIDPPSWLCVASQRLLCHRRRALKHTWRGAALDACLARRRPIPPRQPRP